MRRDVDHADLAAAGYFADWAPKTGDTAVFHLSSSDPDAGARVVRLDRAAIEAVDWPVARSAAPIGVRSLEVGSWIEIAGDTIAPGEWSLSFELRLVGDAGGRPLVMLGDRTVQFDGGGAVGFDRSATTPIPHGRWLKTTVEQDGETLRVSFADEEGFAATAETTCAPCAPGLIRIGRAGDDAPTLNAMIGRIALRSGGRTIATWRFPAIGRPERLAPTEGGAGELAIRNAPTFALRSPRWDGTVLDPRLAPEHYDAIALHDDDLADAGWPATHAIDIPATAESGVYALEVGTGGGRTRWPFFVTPRRRGADLVFLAPTFTYLAYADERLPPEQFPWLCDDAGHRFARANRLTSLYDMHDDGSGVSLAHFHRPLVTIRDDYRYPLCGAPHLLPVDLHLLRFLNAEGIKYDVLTDADLHRDGIACLQDYRALVTGSHPEYWSGAMLDAVTALRRRGGHIAYLGGNGCYWVTASDGKSIEVRRGLAGIRTWSSAPGETHLAMTGEPGGLWRHRGRAEHLLLGVGLAAMGFTAAHPYRRTADSFAPDLAWLFEGVGDEAIGTDGILLGGAAGYEIDSRSAHWGTPAETVALAVAEGFDAGYVRDPDSTVDDHPAPIRGEITLTRPASGGMVFAAGSVSWCGALPHCDISAHAHGAAKREMNAVGMITRNLLHRITS